MNRLADAFFAGVSRLVEALASAALRALDSVADPTPPRTLDVRTPLADEPRRERSQSPPMDLESFACWRRHRRAISGPLPEDS